jgi:hypothetical protein
MATRARSAGSRSSTSSSRSTRGAKSAGRKKSRAATSKSASSRSSTSQATRARSAGGQSTTSRKLRSDSRSTRATGNVPRGRAASSSRNGRISQAGERYNSREEINQRSEHSHGVRRNGEQNVQWNEGYGFSRGNQQYDDTRSFGNRSGNHPDYENDERGQYRYEDDRQSNRGGGKSYPADRQGNRYQENERSMIGNRESSYEEYDDEEIEEDEYPQEQERESSPSSRRVGNKSSRGSRRQPTSRSY